MKHAIDTMERTSIEVYESKKTALAAGDDAVSKQIGQGKDIMSVLRAPSNTVFRGLVLTAWITVKANMLAKEEDRLSEDELLAQMKYTRIPCCFLVLRLIISAAVLSSLPPTTPPQAL